MENIALSSTCNNDADLSEVLLGMEDVKQEGIKSITESYQDLAEILVVTSYPPRECGIATYSQDLIKVLNNKFSNSFSIRVCAMESGIANFSYPDEVKYVLNTSLDSEYTSLASKINIDNHINIVLIQHEFGFFHKHEESFLQFLTDLSKPIVVVFHTVL